MKEEPLGGEESMWLNLALFPGLHAQLLSHSQSGHYGCSSIVPVMPVS